MAAAITIMDTVLAGEAVERVLTTWARRHRFAGSGDRAAIRDLVFDAVRRLQSSAALGGGMTGRGVLLGLLRQTGHDPDAYFTGIAHAPPILTDAERATPALEDPLVACDCPAWLAPALRTTLGTDLTAVMTTLQQRAPVFLRVNLRKATVDGARVALADAGIETRPGPLSPSALEVVTNPRRVAASPAFTEGLVELQDAASQAVADAVPLAPDARVLDYCAGGGGKALALAARSDARIFVHDADPARMSDLPSRARRAGAHLTVLDTSDAMSQAPFDTVLVDAPCSGSGAWRRAPQGKWLLDRAGLDRLCALQDQIFEQAAPLVARGGALIYATCSMLACENTARVERFMAARPGFFRGAQRQFTPLDGADGFFYAILTRE